MLNIILIAGLALLFGFWFYRPLRLVVNGIEQLSEEVVQIIIAHKGHVEFIQGENAGYDVLLRIPLNTKTE
jgi:hypothetical protein